MLSITSPASSRNALPRAGTLALMLWFFLVTGAWAQGDLKLKFSDGLEGYYEPLIVSEILSQNIPEKILGQYRRGEYRNAIVDLRRLKNLQLPDGRLDVYTFMEAECYLQLGLLPFAQNNFQEIVEYFPESRITQQSLFRLVQIHSNQRNDSLLAHYHGRLKKEFAQSPLISGSTYLLAKSLYLGSRFSRAQAEARNISPASPYFFTGKFLQALCYIQEPHYDSALLVLSEIAAGSQEPSKVNEARFTMGLIYEKTKKTEQALAMYDKVERSSERFSLATLKKALIYLKKKQYKKVVKTAQPVLDEPNYFFEASFVLLDTYWTLKDSIRAEIVRNRLSVHAKLTRTRIVLEEEKIFLQDLTQKLSVLANSPGGNRYKEFIKTAGKRIDVLNKQLEALTAQLQQHLPQDTKIVVAGIREQKLLQRYEVRVKLLESEIEKQREKLNSDSSLTPEARLRQADQIDSLKSEAEEARYIVGELLKLNQDIIEAQSEAAELQPKFIDVGMIMYRKLKENYQEANQKIRDASQRLFELEAEKNRRKNVGPR